MKRKIIIMLDSDILSRGLSSIIGNLPETEIICVAPPEELEQYAGITRSVIALVIRPEQLARYTSFVHRLGQTNTVQVITFGLPGADRTKGQSITLDMDGESIRQLILKVLNVDKNEIEPPPSMQLSERETEVLRLVARGYANKEIAARLFISVHTVISHRKNITEKLGIKSISGLTVYAILNKLIDTSGQNPETLI
ncbi:MAG: hypothetical protein GXO81_01525 [Chlorobi bacterium]|nr:hypothetical protein [Chlorobiota bacterium]